MNINIGDNSGCLKVIDFNKSFNEEIHNYCRPMAEKFWSNELAKSSWRREFYGLTKEEENKCLEKEVMPDTFIEKYIAHTYSTPPFLYHEKKPNTFDSLKKAIEEEKLIKVQCKRCGRFFFTDEESFRCVKWQRCLKVECDKSTIVQKEMDYTARLYQWDCNNTSLQVLNSQLAIVEDITNPLPYYNSTMKAGAKARIAYISDIHIGHHIKGERDKFVRKICHNLFLSNKGAHIILFNGDIDDNPEHVMKFFDEYVRQYEYKDYKIFMSNIRYYKRIIDKYLVNEDGKYKLCIRSPKEQRLEKIEKYIKYLYKIMIDEYHFNYDLLDTYRSTYRYLEESIEKVFSMYKKTKGYINQEVEKENEFVLEQLVYRIDKLKRIASIYQEDIEDFYNAIDEVIEEIVDWENKYKTSVKDLNLSFFKRRCNLRNDYGIKAYFVLGNHEYICFSDTKNATEYYKDALDKYGITLLQNAFDCVDTDDNEVPIIIYGGTGFAKYNQQYNANNIICCPGFTRKDEIRETELFEKGYLSALEYAKSNNYIFICASHYPIDSCLNNHYDAETIYFTGHNHRNEYVYTETKALYADNQIGYINNDIYFKIANIGMKINPYFSLKDGLYETSIDKYLEFYRYLGESIGSGAALYKKCDGINSNLYVAKHKGYYGFFVMTSSGSSTTKGIYIVNGGKIKKITTSIDLNWICENFDIVLTKYLKMLTPLRTTQQRISKELKELGLDGTIHGTIVDIDFYHHIMVNPLDGTVSFYYSPAFGLVQNLETFDDVIRSLEDKKSHRLVDKEKYKEKIQERTCLLHQISKNYLISQYEDSLELDGIENPIHLVSKTEGAYGVSKKISPLQRLFEGKVLRDFDIRLAETNQKAHRNNLLLGRILCYEGVEYEIIEDDGSDIIGAIEKKSSIEGVSATNIKRLSVVELKSKIRSQSMANEDTYWID